MKQRKERTTGPTVAWLLTQIDAFLDLNDMPGDGCLFGWYAMRDSSLVSRLREGKDVTTSKLDDILAFMQNPSTVTRSVEPKTLNLKPLNIKRRTLP